MAYFFCLQNGDVKRRISSLPNSKIDFILVSNRRSEVGGSELAAERRRVFEANLEKEGLVLETVD